MSTIRALLGLCLVAVSCGHEPAPGESVAEVCRLENNGHEVHLSGYLVPPVVTLGCRESCSLHVGTTRNDRDGVTVTFPVGTGPGTMNAIEPLQSSIPGEVRRLSPRDYQLRDDRGRTATLGDVVRVGGTLHATRWEGRVECSLRAPSVEAL